MGCKVGKSVEPGKIDLADGRQSLLYRVLNVEVAALKDGIGVVELAKDNQRPGLVALLRACPISSEP